MKRNVSILLSGLFFGCLIVTLIIVHYGIGNAQNIQAVDKEVKEAVLSEDWAKVAKLLDSVTPQTPSPVLRLIKGHTTLALNRNNESLCLFLSVSSEDDIRKWEEWSQDFVKKHPKNVIAFYFRGDALARQEQWDEALGSFNKALDINPKHAMTLNARGVVFASKGELGKAREDFDNAISVDKSFADSYANLGARFIQMKDGAQGAIKVFNEALMISPDFALALHGRGNVDVILFQIDEAEKDLKNAEEYGTCAKELFKENFINIASYINGVDKKELIAMLSKEEIGMSLKRTFETPIGTPGLKQFENSLNSFKQFGGKPVVGQHSFNRIGESYYHLSPTERNTADKMIGTFLDKNPNLNKSFYDGATKLTDNPIRSFEYNVKGSFGSNKMGVESSVKIPASNTDQAYKQIGTNFKNMAVNSITNPPEGVYASLADTNWDEGEWPFVGYYGLLYGLKSKGISLTTNEQVK